MPILQALDYLGTVAFAISGALAAVRKGMDIFGVAVLAAVTAIGGGTVRDALLRNPIFWLQDGTYVLLALTAAVVVFLLYPVMEKSGGALLAFDAVGLGVFTAIGALKAQAAHTGLVGIVTMACLTGVGGGMIRDLLAREVPIVLREEVYASASIAGALAFWGLWRAGAGDTPSICVAAALTVLIRALSIKLGWRLPKRPAGAGNREPRTGNGP